MVELSGQRGAGQVSNPLQMMLSSTKRPALGVVVEESMEPKLAIFSFFAGAGFLDLGFERSGFSIDYVNEYHAPFMEGYQHSRAKLCLPKPRYGCDTRSINELTSDFFAPKIAEVRAEGSLVGFIGGPPCPDFSVGGKNRGGKGENGKLSQVYCDLIRKAKPDFFLFENVKGLYRTKKHREFFEKIKRELKRAGYTLHERLINSIEYGAPQDRDRIILIGFKDKSLRKGFEWSGRTYPERKAFDFNWPNTDTFIADGQRAAPNSVPLELTVQYWFDLNEVESHPNADRCFKPRAGLAKFEVIAEGDDSKKSYKRLHRWRYSPTAAYGNNEVHLHPYKPRRLTVAEALAVQSLPADFELPLTMTLSNMFKTIGNGVPYLAALGLAQSIRDHMGVRYESNSAESSSSDQ